MPGWQGRKEDRPGTPGHPVFNAGSENGCDLVTSWLLGGGVSGVSDRHLGGELTGRREAFPGLWKKDYSVGLRPLHSKNQKCKLCPPVWSKQ